MANQIFIDFNNYNSVEEVLQQWTPRWKSVSADWELVSLANIGKVLRHGYLTSRRSLLSYNGVDNINDKLEIVTKFRTTGTLNSSNSPQLRARCSGTGSETGIIAYDNSDTKLLTISGYLNGSSIEQTTISNTIPKPSIIYWYRIRLEGNNVYLKLWEDGQAEPIDWSLTATISTIPIESGLWNGIGAFASTYGIREWMCVGFGINGATAPKSITDIDTTPPGEVTNFRYQVDGNTFDLLWSFPSDSDLSHAKIYKNGVLLGSYSKPFGWASFNTSDFPTTCTFKITTVDTIGNESQGVTITYTPPDTTPPGEVTDLYVYYSESTGTVWYFCTKPNDLDYNHAKLYVDGTIMYTNAVTDSFAEINIPKDKNAVIKVTTIDNNGNESTGVEYTYIAVVVVETPVKYVYSSGFSLPIYSTLDNRPVRISLNGSIGAFELVDVSDSYASPFRVQTTSGIKAIKRG